MKKLVTGLLIIACIAAVFTGCSKKEDKVITIASDATWPPMEYVNENKEIVGFDIDLINAVAEAGGFEIEIKNTAWDGIFAGLANNAYDAVISSVTITEERKAAMDFSDPYINAGQVIITAKSNNAVKVLSDLKGTDVGAQIGTTGAMAIDAEAGVNLKSYDEIGFAVEDLANGNISAVVADGPIAADFVMSNDNYKDRLKIVGEPFTDEFYGIAVNKGNKEVLDLINKGLAEIIKSGKRDELVSKWLR